MFGWQELLSIRTEWFIFFHKDLFKVACFWIGCAVKDYSLVISIESLPKDK